MKNTTARRPRPTSRSNKGLGNLPLSYLVVIAICGCVIAAGFLLAARQHFVSMDLGMKNSKLRKQLEDLETEQRRLLLAKEVALSPKEITRTARNLGFVDTLEASLAVPVTIAESKPGNAKVTNAVASQNSVKKPSSVATTAYQRPVAQPQKNDLTKKTASQRPLKNG